MYQAGPLTRSLLNSFRWLPIKQIQYFSEMYVILERVTRYHSKSKKSKYSAFYRKMKTKHLFVFHILDQQLKMVLFQCFFFCVWYKSHSCLILPSSCNITAFTYQKNTFLHRVSVIVAFFTSFSFIETKLWKVI